jgi:hypothetical protein
VIRLVRHDLTLYDLMIYKNTSKIKMEKKWQHQPKKAQSSA